MRGVWCFVIIPHTTGCHQTLHTGPLHHEWITKQAYWVENRARASSWTDCDATHHGRFTAVLQHMRKTSIKLSRLCLQKGTSSLSLSSGDVTWVSVSWNWKSLKIKKKKKSGDAESDKWEFLSAGHQAILVTRSGEKNKHLISSFWKCN